jgi:hypothetical protein
MFLSDTSALVTALATDGTDLAWSALPDAPIVDDSRATESLLTAARRAVRHVLRGGSASAAGGPTRRGLTPRPRDVASPAEPAPSISTTVRA